MRTTKRGLGTGRCPQRPRTAPMSRSSSTTRRWTGVRRRARRAFRLSDSGHTGGPREVVFLFLTMALAPQGHEYRQHHRPQLLGDALDQLRLVRGDDLPCPVQ